LRKRTPWKTDSKAGEFSFKKTRHFEWERLEPPAVHRMRSKKAHICQVSRNYSKGWLSLESAPQKYQAGCKQKRPGLPPGGMLLKLHLNKGLPRIKLGRPLERMLPDYKKVTYPRRPPKKKGGGKISGRGLRGKKELGGGFWAGDLKTG